MDGMRESFSRTVQELRRRLRPKEPDSLMRQQIEAVYSAVFDWSNRDQSPYAFEEGKPFLPDKPVIPLSSESLIATACLRGDDDLYVPRKPEDDPSSGYFPYVLGYDQIVIPKDFIRKGEYIVLLVPKYSVVTREKDSMTLDFSDQRRGLTGYGITVLYGTDKGLVKLMSQSELTYRESRQVLEGKNFIKAPMPTPRNNEFFYPDHVNLETISLEESGDSVSIWLGNTLRETYSRKFGDEETEESKMIDSFRMHEKQTKKQTVCYRFVIGNPEQKKVPRPLGRLELQQAPANQEI